MKMKRIGSIKVLGFPLDVYVCKKWPKIDDGTKCYAYLQSTKGRIVIKSGLSQHRMIETLAHEIIHEIAAGLSIVLTEADVCAIARAMYSTGILQAPPLGK